MRETHPQAVGSASKGSAPDRRSPIPGPCVLFAGGGSGGHIFPNLAVAERLSEEVSSRFLVSDRAIDTTIMNSADYAWTPAPAKPLYRKPGPLAAFVKGYFATKSLARRLIGEHHIRAVVATGGFVTTPAAVVARKLGVPVALVSLDAVPGKANRAAARHATKIFSVYETPRLPGAERIGLPLRRASLATVAPREARKAFGLDPDRLTVLVFAGSQGGASINRMMIAWAQSETAHPRSAIQLLHFTGPSDVDAVAAAYAAVGIPHHVKPFCDQMGRAWGAADLAICRAGAGSVAEAWANAVPAIFLPYPYHRDQHQRLNAQPLVDAGGAIVVQDLIDPVANLDHLMPLLGEFFADSSRLDVMRRALETTRPEDGAGAVARWLMQVLSST